MNTEGRKSHILRCCGWYSCGVFSAGAIGLLAGAAFVATSHGFSAREEPSAAERWIARRARTAALPADAAKRANPVANTTEVIASARAHWADHCATCHANDGSGDTQMGRRTYPPAPDMRRPETQQLTDGELFYVIQNGIRLTAMPAWGDSASGSLAHDELDSWKLVHFIRHLPQLTFEEKREMEKMNPKGPEDRREEEEEEKFLRGEDTSEHQTEHHHH
jgi:mono/diheme cytochrome c family protein